MVARVAELTELQLPTAFMPVTELTAGLTIQEILLHTGHPTTPKASPARLSGASNDDGDEVDDLDPPPPSDPGVFTLRLTTERRGPSPMLHLRSGISSAIAVATQIRRRGENPGWSGETGQLDRHTGDGQTSATAATSRVASAAATAATAAAASSLSYASDDTTIHIAPSTPSAALIHPAAHYGAEPNPRSETRRPSVTAAVSATTINAAINAHRRASCVSVNMVRFCSRRAVTPKRFKPKFEQHDQAHAQQGRPA